MSKDYEKPTRIERDDVFDKYEEEHPAFAMIGASRVQGTHHALFGSDFEHQHFITITIKGARVIRDLSSDWYSTAGLPTYIEVSMSMYQWAEFISTLNVGDGVPCTIEFIGGEGHIPAIDKVEDRRQQLREEVSDTQADAIKAIEALRDAAPNKKLRDLAETALREMRSNLPFVAKQFDEHAEKTVARAKVEIETYITNAIHRAGVAALSGGQPPFKVLSEGEAVTPEAE